MHVSRSFHLLNHTRAVSIVHKLRLVNTTSSSLSSSPLSSSSSISAYGRRHYSASSIAKFTIGSQPDTLEFHDTHIRMPCIGDAPKGMIDKWMKKEGDSFYNGEPLCEVTLDGLTIQVEAPREGVISEILLHEGESIEINKTIARFVYDKEEYFNLVECQRIEIGIEEKMADLKEISEPKIDVKTVTEDVKVVLLREVRHLIQSGQIKGDSPFAKTLQVLARKQHKDLVSIFEASYEGVPSSTNATFDSSFFIENATEIVKEYEESIANK